MLRECFSNNLRQLCAGQESIAHVCRSINVNRQQFNNYLNGRNLPNETIVRKLCEYFDVEIGALFSDHRPVVREVTASETRRPACVLANQKQQTDEIARLHPVRIHDGLYRIYYVSPGASGLFRSMLAVRRKDGAVLFTRVTRAVLPGVNGLRKLWRHTGTVHEYDQITYLVGSQCDPVPFPSLIGLRQLELGFALHIGAGLIRIGSNLASVSLALVPSAESLLDEVRGLGHVDYENDETRTVLSLLNGKISHVAI